MGTDNDERAGISVSAIVRLKALLPPSSVSQKKATQIVSTLKGHYDDDALSRMLVVAKNVPSTKKLASGQFSVLLKISEGVRFNIPQPIDDLTGN
ncbi:hypothetical protein PC116_g10591 [Phytophthora cactorum]|nr:hypothetical protein PC112_g7574 [Phytophthora cactorum]KAG2838405.1 hypothetical protein PC111_g4278 [Phytophthora cactorum]KAG2860967.1 hypothetical protein PC113_g7596 [Phytophthora cactorum]KAG2988433.1 hypothetical protein PC118_g6728 [Phytophthora cactorum]KAG3023958.1 hypothetical protein PC119_g8732 [Phytophthora cactorum]